MRHLLLLLTLMCSLSVLSAQASSELLASADQPIELRVYPNPATDYIQINNNNSVQLVAVYNLAGRQVRSFKYANHEKYFIGDLPRGMYLVQLLGHQNNRLVTRRLNIR